MLGPSSKRGSVAVVFSLPEHAAAKQIGTASGITDKEFPMWFGTAWRENMGSYSDATATNHLVADTAATCGVFGLCMQVQAGSGFPRVLCPTVFASCSAYNAGREPVPSNVLTTSHRRGPL